jgi:hypothetical protein
LSSGSIDENGSVTLSGSFTDPGLPDSFTVVIDLGPGQGTTTVNLAASETTFSASHQFLDDGASPGNGTPSDVYQVSVTVTDDDGGADTDSASVTVNNVAPVVDLDVTRYQCVNQCQLGTGPKPEL